MQPEANTPGHAAVLRAARLFRLGMDGDANSSLVVLVDDLATRLAAGELAAGETIAELLGQVLAAQERGDVLGLADLLEFGLAPHLAC